MDLFPSHLITVNFMTTLRVFCPLLSCKANLLRAGGLGTAGNNRGLGTAGDNRGLETNGDNRGLGTVGDNRGLGTAGDNRGLGTAGDNRGLGTTGDNRGLETAGDNSGLGTAVDNRGLETAGDDADLGTREAGRPSWKALSGARVAYLGRWKGLECRQPWSGAWPHTLQQPGAWAHIGYVAAGYGG